MSNNLNKTKRIYSLDALRAIMMLLGVVLHSSLTYSVTEFGKGWPIKDPNTTSLLMDFIVFLIHSFRMPVFFIVAGFFGALLYYERGIQIMIKNRVSRILFPFMAFILLLYPLLIFVFKYTLSSFNGAQRPIEKSMALLNDWVDYIPQMTFHLWFLYYLLLYTVFTIGVVWLMDINLNLKKRLINVFAWLLNNIWAGILFFGLLTFVTLSYFKTFSVEASVSFIPEFKTFGYFISFYIFGWGLFKFKQRLAIFEKYVWHLTIVGILLLLIQGELIQAMEGDLILKKESLLLISFSSIIVWTLSFGVIGLFAKYASQYSKRMRYISDASYWVYLIHLPIVVFLPSLLAEYPISPFIKFSTVVISAMIICFLTYHYFVRKTFVGQFLNGRKYK